MTDVFDSKSITAEEQEHLATLRALYKQLASAIAELCPIGRYTALSLTELENSAMWATKSISHKK